MSAIIRYKHFKKMDSHRCRVFEKLIVEIRATVPKCERGISGRKKHKNIRSPAQKRERTKKATNQEKARSKRERRLKRKAKIKAKHILHIQKLAAISRQKSLRVDF